MGKPSKYSIVNYVIMAIGIFLLILVWWQQRGLFIDEANLARNIVEKNFIGLFSALEYQQYCPPFLLTMFKGTSMVFGTGEKSLRLVSLLMSIGSLFLLFQIVRKEFDESILWFPLALVGLSPVFIRYGTELKQYGPDAFFTLLMVYLIQRYPIEDWSLRRSWIAGLIGATLVWFSMPAIFLMIGVGAWQLYYSIRSSQNFKNVIAFGMPVALSFLGYYFLLISTAIDAPNLQSYHNQFFLPLIPQSVDEFTLLGNLLLVPFQTALGSTTFEIIIGVILVALGIWTIAKNNRPWLWLVVLPITLTMLASSLELYSLRPRLILFFIPLMILVMTHGLSRLWFRFSWLRMVFVALLMIVFINWEPWNFVVHRYEVEELKQSLSFLCQGENKDPVYVDKFASPTFQFYLSHDDIFEGCQSNNMSFIKKENQEEIWIKGQETKQLKFVYGAMTKKQLEVKEGLLSQYGKIDSTRVWTGATLVTLSR